MSQDVRIDAAARDRFGKGASRQFRREGKVPAVVYGSGSEVRHLVLPAHELSLALRIPRVVLQVEVEGEDLLVAPRDVQKDPVRQDLLHLDLVLLSKEDVAARHAYADALAKAEATAAAAAAAAEDAKEAAAEAASEGDGESGEESSDE